MTLKSVFSLFFAAGLGAAGCQSGSQVDLADRPAPVNQGLEVTYATADAVVFQPNFESNRPRETNSYGFDTDGYWTNWTITGGMAVDGLNGRVWVADPGNGRALAFPIDAAVGDPATVVLGQLNAEDHNHRSIPNGGPGWPRDERIQPTGVAVDSEGRVYLAEDQGENLVAKVLVYDNPMADATLSSYELVSTPINFSAIRRVFLGPTPGTEHIAVVGEGAVQFYPMGQPEPIATYHLEYIPCAGSRGVTDIGQVGGTLLVACGDSNNRCEELGQLGDPPVFPYIGPPGSFCSAVYAYRLDDTASSTNYYQYNIAVSNVPEHVTPLAPPQPIPAYVSTQAIATVHGSGDLVFVGDQGSRVLRYQAATAHLDLIFGQPPNANAAHANGPQIPLNAVGPVYGQANYTDTGSNTPNARPLDRNLFWPSRAEVDANGNMWILDTYNNRVLRYDDASGAAGDNVADVVLGQSTYEVGLQNQLESFSCQTVSAIALKTNNWTYVVDRSSHRVMVFEDAFALHDFRVPTYALGQSWLNGYLQNALSVQSGGNLQPPDLSFPSHIAIAQNNYVYINDAGNYRITIRWTDNPTPDSLIGSTGFDTPGERCFVYGAMAVHYPDASPAGVLFVATGARVAGITPGPECEWNDTPNRIFAYNLPHTKLADENGDPDFVLGQDLMPNLWEVRNFPNRNAGGPRPDSFWRISGLATEVLPDGATVRLWVVDQENRRVLWFDNPMDPMNPVPASTAEGVVGQPHMAANFLWYDPQTGTSGFQPNAYGFQRPHSVVVDPGGGIWVSDEWDNRVLYFPTPTVPDETGVPRATTVLGQKDFDRNFNNDGWPSGRALSQPRALGLDATGRLLLVADTGNTRMLRFYRNDPPTLAGGTTIQVVEGESGTITFAPEDPDGDNLDAVEIIATHPPNADVTIAAGAVTLNSAPGDELLRTMVAGEIVRVEVSVTEADTVPRQETATAWGAFQITAQPDASETWSPCNPTGGAGGGGGTPPDFCLLPEKKTFTDLPLPETGCLCSGGTATLLPGLLLLLFWRRRRR